MRIGIRREDKNEWERRVPLIPEHVRGLVAQGIEVVVQPSPVRAFPEADYRDAGAAVREDLSDCAVVFAVKEIPKELLVAGQAYLYFAHVVKGQAHNMPMLAKLLELGCTLIDYERITDDQGRRLIFFGRHAGLAGMVDTLWALGRRLAAEGIRTPFLALEPTHAYADLEAAKLAVRRVAADIAAMGLPAALGPVVMGFTGYGNVSRGAQEIFDLLPHREMQPEALRTGNPTGNAGEIIKVVFKEEHLVEPIDPSHPFRLQEYYDHPDRYRGIFERYLPSLTVLVNCIFWTSRYPRLVTLEALERLFAQGQPRLRAIGDISCDIAGSIECNRACTEPGDPVYVYRVADRQIVPGVEGAGPVVLAVDNLPCELPVEASRDFGDALMPYAAAIARTDLTRPFERLGLPAPVQRAVITHAGRLTPSYAYLQTNLDRAAAGGAH